VDLPKVWRQMPLRRDRRAIGAHRALSGFDHRRCDEYLCTSGEIPVVPECRAEREGVGPTQKDGE
jgi:hypothetical protein